MKRKSSRKPGKHMGKEEGKPHFAEGIQIPARAADNFLRRKHEMDGRDKLPVQDADARGV